MLIIELRDPHAARHGGFVDGRLRTCEDDRKLIIDGHVTSAEATITRVGSGRDSTLANNSRAGCNRGPFGVPRPSKGDVRR